MLLPPVFLAFSRNVDAEFPKYFLPFAFMELLRLECSIFECAKNRNPAIPSSKNPTEEATKPDAVDPIIAKCQAGFSGCIQQLVPPEISVLLYQNNTKDYKTIIPTAHTNDGKTFSSFTAGSGGLLKGYQAISFLPEKVVSDE